jgi:hypothetical protein
MPDTPIRIVQLSNSGSRRIALVDEPRLRLISNFDSVFALANEAIARQVSLSKLALDHASSDEISYDAVYSQNSDWKLLPSADIPNAPERVLVSGTGLTHLGSARDRQAMHAKPAVEESQMTDSMRMFEWGRQNGRPAAGQIGIAPEWFYKGDGSMLRPAFAQLEVPPYGEDGGEEAEIAAIYVIGSDGSPYRVGLTNGNEFSDHIFERRNYLNLAGSKLRMCSIGPELVIGHPFADIPGKVQILRDGKILWQKNIRTGEENMCHSLANLEHHHFKFEGHRQPGRLHVHFMGADTLSFGEGVRLEAGDVTEVAWEGFGRPLRNVIAAHPQLTAPVRVHTLQ